ncbi:MAG: multidrug transporter permease [Ignavibacteria bacterium]|nr:multidrug transporter permease [Ignavibacteria bacterium]
MLSFNRFIIKEIYHIFRDKRTLLVMFGMPIAQLIIFGFAIRTEINDINIAVLDYSKDNITQKITNRLISSGYFKLHSILNNTGEIEKGFRAAHFKEVVVFEQNFAKKAEHEGEANIQLIIDASAPNVATLINAYTISIIQEASNDLKKSSIVPSFIVQPEFKMMYNPELKSVYLFVPGLLAIIMMLVCALMTSITITREKELGTMEILLVSPLKPVTIIIGKVTPYAILSLINATTILILGIVIFKLPFNGSIIFFYLETFLFIITTLALGILISTFSSSQQVALMISLAGLMMPTLLLSGFIFPIENMPYPLQLLSCIIPARWYLIIVKGIMLKGVGIEYLWKETIYLALFAIFFIVISIKKFKIRLE